jgi:signal transduction histidine kinase
LGLIRGWAQRLAQSGTTDAKGLKHTQAVIEECDRVAARINQFLAFARPCEPSPEPVKPCELIDELGTILQPDLEAKGLRISCSGLSTDGAIRADRELLRQALFNMLLNAVNFAPEGDTVTAEVTSTREGRFRIAVSDRGPGVPEDAVGSLFTPYYTTRPDGTGLGLATVRRIAAAHGWHAGYLARPEGGSVFYLDGIHG